jgi:hypothetical protein
MLLHCKNAETNLSMQYKLPTLLALSLIAAGTLKAQTVSTFEDITLPAADTTYLESTVGPDGIYPFESGNVKFYGKKDFGGSYYANFNTSNHTDTVTPGFGNMWSNIAGGGAESSANFGIAYVETDYAAPSPVSIPVGVKLMGSAPGHQVAGTYVTNSVYAYRYMLDNNFYATQNHWFKLVVRGYELGVQNGDSVIFTLADFSGTNDVLVNTWQWVDLMSLGSVDSVTFDVISSDAGMFGINTPMYFAIDNFTTLDASCPPPINIAAISLNENSATIDWEEGIGGLTTNYEIAVDQSPTLAPTATATAVTNSTYGATGLSNNTQYYAHVRAVCGNAQFSVWDTAAFKTLGNTGIFQTNENSLQVNIWPNPATDRINISSTNAVTAVVYSIEGKELMQVENAKNIDISELAAGVYVLKIREHSDSGKQATLRFTKK